jgi:DNA-binding NarL/FixJ family response regulator
MSAIRAVHGGGAFLSPQIARQVIQRVSGSRMRRQSVARERIAVLSPRERDVLALVGVGPSNAEIGVRLFLVEGTVKAYVSAVLGCLEVRNRVQAAVLAYEADLPLRVGQVGGVTTTSRHRATLPGPSTDVMPPRCPQ